MLICDACGMTYTDNTYREGNDCLRPGCKGRMYPKGHIRYAIEKVVRVDHRKWTTKKPVSCRVDISRFQISPDGKEAGETKSAIMLYGHGDAEITDRVAAEANLIIKILTEKQI